MKIAGPRGAVGSASDSRTRGPGFDARSGHILLFTLLLVQEGHLSVTGDYNGLSTGKPIMRSKPSVVR